MIDLRWHILSGTPCGPESFAESVQMCRAAIADGVQTLVASPRWEAEQSAPPLSFDKCEQQISRLMDETGGSLKIKLGFGLQFSPRLPELTDQYGARLAVGGKRYLMVSMPTSVLPADTEEVWSSLNGKGFRVIVAHPECSPAIRRQPERLSQWMDSGVILQIDAGSVAGTHGREVLRFAFDCLQKYGENIVVASNTRPGGEAKHPLSKIRETLVDKVGAGMTAKIMTETPLEIVGDSTEAQGAGQRPVRGSLSTVLCSFSPLRTLIGGL